MPRVNRWPTASYIGQYSEGIYGIRDFRLVSSEFEKPEKILIKFRFHPSEGFASAVKVHEIRRRVSGPRLRPNAGPFGQGGP